MLDWSPKSAVILVKSGEGKQKQVIKCFADDCSYEKKFLQELKGEQYIITLLGEEGERLIGSSWTFSEELFQLYCYKFHEQMCSLNSRISRVSLFNHQGG